MVQAMHLRWQRGVIASNLEATQHWDCAVAGHLMNLGVLYQLTLGAAANRMHSKGKHAVASTRNHDLRYCDLHQKPLHWEGGGG